MKQLLFLLFAFVVIGVNAQVGTIPTITGSNSGDGEIKAIVAQAQTNDDNVQDSIDANALLIATNIADIDTLGSPPHASLAFEDSAFVIPITQGIFAKVTNTGNDLFTLIDADDMTAAGDTMTVIKPGTYLVMAGLSFSGSASDVWEFAVFKNGVKASAKMERSTSQTDIGAVPLPFYMEDLEAGDDLSLRITNTASSDDATVVACSWVTWRLHE